MKSPYQIIKRRRVTEKSRVLEELQHKASNRSLSRCKSPKVVFDVDRHANKVEIKKAIEEIYKRKKVKVVAVNTMIVGPKKRRVRGHSGETASLKKAVVTFRPGDVIDEQG